MTVISVKSAAGCRVRDPRTGAVLPNVSDSEAKGYSVDLDDPYWFRSMASGDIVPAKDAASAPSSGTPEAIAPAQIASSPTTSSPANSAPAASGAVTSKSA